MNKSINKIKQKNDKDYDLFRYEYTFAISKEACSRLLFSFSLHKRGEEHVINTAIVHTRRAISGIRHLRGERYLGCERYLRGERYLGCERYLRGERYLGCERNLRGEQYLGCERYLMGERYLRGER